MATVPDLSVRLGRLKLANPVITASGTFGYGEEYAGYLDVDRLGALTTKAITLKPRDGNEPPRIIETTAGVLNAIGLANVGVAAFIRDKMPYLRSLKSVKVIVNVAGSTQAGYCEVVRQLEGVKGIAGLEINISCPNVKQGGMAFGADPVRAYRLVAALRKLTKRFLLVKLTPNVTDIAGIARKVEQAGADGISLINTLSGMVVDLEARKPALANVYGGLSGPAIKPVGLACVHKVYTAVKIPVVGGGGIMNAADALEYMVAGARAVQIGTASFVDPGAAARVVGGIKIYCKKHSIRKVSSLTGTLSC